MPNELTSLELGNTNKKEATQITGINGKKKKST